MSHGLPNADVPLTDEELTAIESGRAHFTADSQYITKRVLATLRDRRSRLETAEELLRRVGISPVTIQGHDYLQVRLSQLVWDEIKHRFEPPHKHEWVVSGMSLTAKTRLTARYSCADTNCNDEIEENFDLSPKEAS